MSDEIKTTEESGSSLKKIDIFNIQPSVISRDLSGKSFVFYGSNRTGKTIVATGFPSPIILGFEKGWNMISGVIGQPITKWKDALDVKKQLLADAEAIKKGKKKDTAFKTIVIDTGGIAYTMCEKYILQRENVDYLDETESKRGYKATRNEFFDFLNDIIKAGYTLVVICHAVTVEKKINGKKIEVTQADIDKRGMAILGELVDVIGFATTDSDYHVTNGEDYDTDASHSVYIQRGTDDNLLVGSRNPYSGEIIPFSYQSILDDINKAIDKQEENGANTTDKPTNVYQDVSENMTHEELMSSLKEYANIYSEADRAEDYMRVSNKYLGKGKRVSEAESSQIDLLQLIYDELTEQLKDFKKEEINK